MKKRKDGRYQKRITLPNGKSKLLYSSANTEREAIKDFNRQMLNYEEASNASLMFENAAKEWASVHFKTLENNSLKKYKPALEQAVKYFEGISVKEVTPEEISHYLDFLKSRGFAKKTIKDKFSVLKQFFNYSIVKGYIQASPCQFIKVPKDAKTTPKRQPATTEEEEIIKTLSDNVPFGTLAKLLLFTGCRRGEALVLTPADIDFKNKWISINKTAEWVGAKPQIKNHPKTDAGNRVIPLPDVLIPSLQKLKDQKYLFQNDENELMHNSQITRRWGALRRETGIRCTPHQLRHSYTTMLFDAGIDVKTAQKWLGHKDIKTTLDIYTHLSETRQEQSVEKWFNFVENSVKVVKK